MVYSARRIIDIGLPASGVGFPSGKQNEDYIHIL
jgi:hypothetical protein